MCRSRINQHNMVVEGRKINNMLGWIQWTELSLLIKILSRFMEQRSFIYLLICFHWMLFKCRNTSETATLSSWDTVEENWYVFDFSEKLCQ